MPINVGIAIDYNTGQRLYIKRKSKGKYVDGVWVVGTEQTIKCLGSQQSPKPQELDYIPELERLDDVKVFYLNKPVQVSNHWDDHESDQIEWEGKRYKIMKLNDWSSYGYDKVIGSRVK